MSRSTFRLDRKKELPYFFASSALLLLSILLTVTSCDEKIYACEGEVRTISVFTFRDEA
jgi:hypothetical protein